MTARDQAIRFVAQVKRRPVLIATGLMLLAASTVWLYAGVRNSLIQLAGANLRAHAVGESTTVSTWLAEKRLNVQRWALDERLVAAAEQLLALGPEPTAARTACLGEPGARIVATIDALRQTDAAASVHLVGTDGRLLAARERDLCGISLGAAAREAFAPVFAGAALFFPTTDVRQHLGAAGSRAAGTPLIWFTVPVRNARGEVVAALDVGKAALDRFSALFAQALVGAGGETFAFDQRGVLLSESGHRAALEEAGLLLPSQTTVLRLRLSEPEATVGEPQLTLLVRRALAARAQSKPESAGVELEPYPNVIGRAVVGAWRWLDDYGFGVAVEVPQAEAFAPLKPLETAVIVLGVMVGTTVFAVIVALLRMEGLRAELDEALEARRVGNYELLEQVGAGGMARVYRARHRLLKRPTAVKIIELAQTSDEMLARFDREVRLASQLAHPNTVEIFDYGRTPEGLPFCAMEFLDGLTLQQIVEQHGAFDAPRTLHVLRGIAGSLAEAHARGLVHRDIKPANVMLCHFGGEYDVVKVLDFGLVKDTRTEQTRDLTRALKILGTPAYMAPERIEHPEGADARSDLYAVGAVGYYMLVGRAPFAGENELALAYQVVHHVPALVNALRAAPVAAELEQLVAQCLAKDPRARPQSAAELLAQIDALLLRQPWSPAHAAGWWQSREAAQRAAA